MGIAWTDQTSGTSANLNDVSFASDALRGIAVGDSGTILWTANGGGPGPTPTPTPTASPTPVHSDSYPYRDTAAYSDAQGSSHTAVSPVYFFSSITLKRQ